MDKEIEAFRNEVLHWRGTRRRGALTIHECNEGGTNFQKTPPSDPDERGDILAETLDFVVPPLRWQPR
jgi:hypothetical protein